MPVKLLVDLFVLSREIRSLRRGDAILCLAGTALEKLSAPLVPGLEFRERILILRKEHGITIMLNSHLLGEVEQMCDRCVIIKEGRKVYEGVVPSQEKSRRLFRLQTPDIGLAREMIARAGASMDKQGIVEVPVEMQPHQLVSALVAGGVPVDVWQPYHRTLEELYMGLSVRS